MPLISRAFVLTVRAESCFLRGHNVYCEDMAFAIFSELREPLISMRIAVHLNAEPRQHVVVSLRSIA